MAEAKFVIKWVTDTAQLKASFREFQKFEKQVHKLRSTGKGIDDKSYKDQVKKLKDLHKVKLGQFGEERRAKLRLNREELEFHRKRRVFLDQTNRDIARGPLGRLLYGRFGTGLPGVPGRGVPPRVPRGPGAQGTAAQPGRGGVGGGILGALGLGGGAIGLGVGAGLAGLGILGGTLIGTALQGYQRWVGFQQSMAGGIGLGIGRLPRGAGGAARGRGGALGYNIQERAQLQEMMARSTGVGGAIATRTVMEGTRATGLAAGDVADLMGAIRQGGVRFAGQATVGDARGREQLTIFQGRGKQEFTRILAAGMYSGLEKGRFVEFSQGVSQFIRQASLQQAGVVTGAGISQLAALLGRAGGEGFRGARGMTLLERFGGGIQAPGGGPEGLAFMRQALGYGVPGSPMGFYDVEKIRERGLVQETPEKTLDVFRKVMEGLEKQIGPNKPMQALVGREVLGLTLNQMEALIGLREKGVTGQAAQDELNKILKEGVSLQEQAYKAMKESGVSLGHIVGRFDKMVGIGGRSADTIQRIEKIQMDVAEFTLNMATQYGPALLKFLKKIYDEIRVIVLSVLETLSKWGIGGVKADPKRTKELELRLAGKAGKEGKYDRYGLPSEGSIAHMIKLARMSPEQRAKAEAEEKAKAEAEEKVRAKELEKLDPFGTEMNETAKIYEKHAKELAVEWQKSREAQEKIANNTGETAKNTKKLTRRERRGLATMDDIPPEVEIVGSKTR